MPYDYGIDVWSVGCTLFELYSGKILFTGRSNNQMLRAIMECRGKFSHKVLRKAEFAGLHFDDLLNFRSVEKDRLSGKVGLILFFYLCTKFLILFRCLYHQNYVFSLPLPLPSENIVEAKNQLGCGPNPKPHQTDSRSEDTLVRQRKGHERCGFEGAKSVRGSAGSLLESQSGEEMHPIGSVETSVYHTFEGLSFFLCVEGRGEVS